MVASLRVLDTGPGEPAANMALDEALLLAGGPPTLRLYGWQPHAVSLGYFQDCAPFQDLPGNPPLVRRLTGGGAILHGDELTFALTLPAELLGDDVAASYALLHGAVRAALAAAGVACRLAAAGGAPTARPRHPWCFAEPGQNDLVDAVGRKLVGSAQRRIRQPAARVLHHGSLVLRRPALTPFCAAVADGADASAAAATLRRTLPGELAAALGLAPVDGTATAAELAMAARLCQQRYLDPGFTLRRRSSNQPGESKKGIEP